MEFVKRISQWLTHKKTKISHFIFVKFVEFQTFIYTLQIRVIRECLIARCLQRLEFRIMLMYVLARVGPTLLCPSLSKNCQIPPSDIGLLAQIGIAFHWS